MSLIPDFEGRLLLGLAVMDDTHREFVDLVNRLGRSEGGAFAPLFESLVVHTREHFAGEEALMEGSRFPAIAEHRSDHRRVLGDLEGLLGRVVRGRTRLARAYVAEQLPAWLSQHVGSMDSALAAHLRGSAATPSPAAPSRAIPAGI